LPGWRGNLNQRRSVEGFAPSTAETGLEKRIDAMSNVDNRFSSISTS